VRYRNLTVLLFASLAAVAALYWSSRLVVSPTPADAPTELPALTATAPAPLMAPATTLPAPSTAPTGTQPITATPTLTVLSASPLAAAPALTATVPFSGRLPLYSYEVVAVYPHDPGAYTQGLLFDQGVLYEGTGLNGRSSVRKVELITGKVLQQVELDPAYFGEGITIFGDQLYQLTWQSQVGFIYDKTSLAKRNEFTYSTEGWGITHDGSRLIMSDGTPRLYFRDPVTLAELGTVDVYDHTGPVVRLNELEYIQGEVYANIWQTDRIARINSATGQVVGWIDLTGLLPAAERTDSSAVLNGIAYLPDEDRLFVTGKLWPKLFEIKLIVQS
jgi:glutamine cyclotransferase